MSVPGFESFNVTKIVFLHDCRMLGKNTKTPRSLITDNDGTYIIGYRHCCPFCDYVADDLIPGKGITFNDDGTYTVDLSIVDKMR